MSTYLRHIGSALVLCFAAMACAAAPDAANKLPEKPQSLAELCTIQEIPRFRSIHSSAQVLKCSSAPRADMNEPPSRTRSGVCAAGMLDSM